MSKYKNSKQTFSSIEDCNKYILSKKGECFIVPYREDKYKVKYERALNEYKIGVQKYCTIKFNSLQTASSFCNRLKKEGLESNVNQDISVKSYSDVKHSVKFILTEPKKYTRNNNNYHNEWVEANLDGSFAYNNSSDDF